MQSRYPEVLAPIPNMFLSSSFERFCLLLGEWCWLPSRELGLSNSSVGLLSIFWSAQGLSLLRMDYIDFVTES